MGQQHNKHEKRARRKALIQRRKATINALISKKAK